MSVVEQHASLVEAERSLRLLQLVAEAEHFAGQLALLDGDVPLAIGSLDPSTVQINPETETGETIEGVVASVPGMGPVATKEVVGGSAIQPRYVEADDGVEVGPVIRADQDQQIVPAETTSTRPTSITRRTQSPSSRVVDPDRKKGSEGGGGNADPLRQYLRETSKYPLLTKEDEVQLAKIIEAGNKATAELEAQPEMDRSDRVGLERKARKGKQAKEDFIQANLRLVVSIAKRHTVPDGMEFLDLIQEGNIGLNSAVDRFNWRKGFKFSTYATWWIRQSITRAKANQGSMIRLSVHADERLRQIRKARLQLTTKLEREPTPEEIADQLEMDIEVLRELQSIGGGVGSLDAPVGADIDGSAVLGDLVADISSSDGYGEIENELVRAGIYKALDVIGGQIKTVVTLRHGLDGAPKRTHAEIANILGISKNLVNVTLRRAESVLRHPISDSLTGAFNPFADVGMEDDPLAWHQQASCNDPETLKRHGIDGFPDQLETFFPTRGGDAKTAKIICANCPVKEVCTEAAIVNVDKHGVWGGLSGRGRRSIRSDRF